MIERAETPEGLVAQLVELLDVETIDTDLYRGARQPGGVGRVFGGQVIAQALQAAQRSIDDGKVAHSLHAYFMRAGSEDHPIIYRVVRDFDGRSFANRRVIAMQRGTPILNMIASFQLPEDGLSHQFPMPDVPPPEALKSESELREEIQAHVPEKLRRFFLRARPIEIRPVDPREWFAPAPREPVQHSWFRVVAPLADDPALHRAMLAYASDMTLLGTCMLPHGVTWMDGSVQTASLDHALWLHEPFRADEWMLYTCDSPWSGHGRGHNRGRIYTAGGRLVASAAQEGLIRKRG
ncbi:acyl-CoA thioesterase II [Sphingomonas spermidinifaciens]|uniref:Acyl-CoA thioesterase 2 n=1 Tax=Sphingomonas spermidinifaciens TaxID=1141889 RepID=A0A2A4B664_9SPHN|nr:acyl-CoA thioesterase II [Sphingomonas spermidinifaciens]PCD03547.1 acyl-CoA thioesterase II [Sphingomonas spermidinifaciens]